MCNVRTRKWDCHGIHRPRRRGPKGGTPPGGNRFGTTERKRRGKEHCHLGETRKYAPACSNDTSEAAGGETRYTLTKKIKKQA